MVLVKTRRLVAMRKQHDKRRRDFMTAKREGDICLCKALREDIQNFYRY